MAASTYFDQVQQLYIAYFGRPADTVGQAYWAGVIDAANGNIASVLAGFSASAESQALFGNKSTIDKVTAIYQNAFNRAPEPAGLAYWVAEIDSGRVTQAQASWTIQQSAGAGDAAAVQNKLTAAKAFTAQIDTTAEIQGYQGAAAAQVARDFLQTVNSNNATATAAVANAATVLGNVVSVGGATGTTFTLTTGLDNLVGTGNNDTFIGDVNTVSAADQINGGAGVDTFNLFGAGATPVLPTLTNIERLVLTNPTAALTADFSGVAGLTEVVGKGIATGSSITVANNVAATIDNGNTIAAATIVNAAAATAATVGLTNGTTVTTLTVDGAAVKTLNVASNGTGANTIGTLAGSAGATAQANSTLNITGSQKLTITDALAANFTTVNASANNAGVNLTFDANAVTVTGGAGADRFNFGANLTKADVVDGGAGVDTIAVSGGADLTSDVVTGLNAVKNVEVLEIAAVATAAATSITIGSAAGNVNNSAFTKVLFNTAEATALDTVTGAIAAHTYAFGSSNAGDATLNLAAGVTTANVAVEGGAAAGVVGNLTVAPLAADLTANPALVSTINLSSTGTTAGVANTVAAITAQAGSTVKVTGSQDLTVSAVTNKATVDASAFTGKLAITGSLAADTITLGSGADTVTVQAKGSTYTATDTITNFAKADTLVLTGTTVTAAANLVKFDAANSVSFEQALISAEQAVATTTNVAWFNFGGNTYVVADTDNTLSATGNGSGDLVVKITGVQTLTADATGIHGAV